MVFTRAQWALREKNGYSFSAAPFGPGEIARSGRYVFALPPRYLNNNATGWEEVGELLGEKALNASCGTGGKTQQARVAH
jgi:hypothetical protein